MDYEKNGTVLSVLKSERVQLVVLIIIVGAVYAFALTQ